MVFCLRKETASKLVELLKFSYENTVCEEPSSAEGQNAKISLRGLVIMYAIGLAKELMVFEEFGTLLAEGGDLVRDFMAGVSKRLA